MRLANLRTLRVTGSAARELRTLAAGAAIVAGLLVAGKGIPAVREWRSQARLERAELELELSRARRLVALDASLRDSLVVRQRRLATYDTLLLAGDDAASAAASLTDALAEAAETAEVQLTTVQADVDSTAARRVAGQALVRVFVRAELTASSSELATMLAWLEECPPLLAVRELTVSQTDATYAADRSERLRVTLVVEGLTWRRKLRARPAQPAPTTRGGRVI